MDNDAETCSRCGAHEEVDQSEKIIEAPEAIVDETIPTDEDGKVITGNDKLEDQVDTPVEKDEVPTEPEPEIIEPTSDVPEEEEPTAEPELATETEENTSEEKIPAEELKETE
jgi:hypothetical protein